MKTSVHVSLDVELARKLDEYATQRRMTRSRAMEELIEQATVGKLDKVPAQRHWTPDDP